MLVFKKGSEPYLGMSNKDVGKFLEKGNTLQNPKNCPEDLWKLIQTSCFAYDPAARLSFSDFNTKFTEFIKKEHDIQMKDNGFLISKTDQTQPNVDSPEEWVEWEKQVKKLNYYVE